MRKLFLLALLSGMLSGAMAQKSDTRFVQITTIESVVSGGLGRSRMIITKEDGSQDEKDLNNLFSITGINFKNIKENETAIIQTIKSYTDNGWKMFSTTPLALSPGSNGSGIFMTRYLLTKEEGKK